MNKTDKVFVAGSTGMVGSAIIRLLLNKGFTNIVGSINRRKPRDAKGVEYLKINLLDFNEVGRFFEKEKPDYVFDAAAKVGGIVANNIYRGQFLFENLQIQNNIIHNAWLHKVKKLLFLGSSCIYPKNAPQPIKEEYLLTGVLEETNEPYAIAKIAGIKMCENYNRQYGTNFISAMPTNLYGTADSYDPQNSHVFPALIRKFHEAKVNASPNVTIWGTGSPMREFMHVDDVAAALYHLMENYVGNEFFNIGWGKDISIKDLALLIKEVIGYEGELVFDTSKPDGTPRKLLDVSRLTTLGFIPKINLKDGIASAYKDFIENYL
ncbi:MAG: GDP-fucose synthetase [Bacteroidetes bacterium 4484_276]|nr:MAG: GDP-fucose synthetase [Bacteroidetes bacterium 4484_276]